MKIRIIRTGKIIDLKETAQRITDYVIGFIGFCGIILTTLAMHTEELKGTSELTTKTMNIGFIAVIIYFVYAYIMYGRKSE